MADIVRDMVAVVKAMSDVERSLLRSARLDKAAWTVWHRVVADRTLGDGHPRFQRPYSHRRVLSYVEGFDALAGYRNEDELEGAIVEAMRQVRLRVLEELPVPEVRADPLYVLECTATGFNQWYNMWKEN